MTKSRFSGLLQPRKAKPAKPKRKVAKPRPEQPAVEGPSSPRVETETREIIVLRPVGKRSRTEYTQVSAYVPKHIHRKTKAALIEDGRDFSDLVTDLLDEWLRSQE